MLIYRFRITSIDQEDFVREVEIQPNQTFLDFHEVLLASADLESCEKAFFYLTDLSYNKRQEISLKPLKKQVKKYDKDLDEIVVETAVVKLMKDSRIKNFIEDPHQKMIYEYHGKDLFIFHVELFKIIKLDMIVTLPRIVKSKGELPKRVEIPLMPVTAEPEEEPLIKSLNISRAMDSLFDGLHENETELAEIENHLDEFIIEEEPEAKTDDESIKHFDEEDLSMDEEHMESLEDFEDLENLEIRHRNFDGESDEM
jgi:hypothetical protein